MRGASEENDFRAGFIFLVLNKFIRICFANIINRREYNKFSGLMDEVVKGFFVFFFSFYSMDSWNLRENLRKTSFIERLSLKITKVLFKFLSYIRLSKFCFLL